MASPFPGMDPYLERHWRDVHARLVVYASGAIQRQLGGGLRARIEERLIVESPLDQSREIYPDVRVFERGLPDHPIASSSATVAEPLVIKGGIRRVPQRYIQIIDIASGGQLITVIEFLSPSNKLRGDAREQYLQKQQEVIAASVNLVEIDLTRSGRRQLSYPVENLPEGCQTTYLACIFRAQGAQQHEIYAIDLRQRLPNIRIPLRQTDPDVVLELQPLIDEAYAAGAYDDLDYTRPCSPPLAGEDEAWARQLLSRSGRRPD
jgi:ribosomal protein S6